MRSLLVFLIFFPLLARADLSTCLVKKYESYSKAKSDYQEKLTDLIVSKYPEFESVANTYMNDQLIRIEKNLISFKYIQKNNPSQLNTTEKINRWVRTTNAQEQEIAENNQWYGEILLKIERSRNRPSLENGDNLRKAMREDIMLLPAFSKITEELLHVTNMLNEEQCKKS